MSLLESGEQRYVKQQLLYCKRGQDCRHNEDNAIYRLTGGKIVRHNEDDAIYRLTGGQDCRYNEDDAIYTG